MKFLAHKRTKIYRKKQLKVLLLLMERKSSYKDNDSSDKRENTRNDKNNISDIDSYNNMKVI